MGSSDLEKLTCLRDGHKWSFPPAFQPWIEIEPLISVTDGHILGPTGREGNRPEEDLHMLACSVMDWATPWTVASQAPLGEFSRQAYWSGFAISYSRGSSWPRDWTCISCIFCIGRQILYHCTTWETLRTSTESYNPSVIILSDSLQWTHSGFLYHIYSSISFKSLKHGFLWKSSTKSSRLHQDQSFYSLSTAYFNGSQTLPYIVSIKVGRGAGLIYWCLNFTLRVKYTLICFPDK